MQRIVARNYRPSSPRPNCGRCASASRRGWRSRRSVFRRRPSAASRSLPRRSGNHRDLALPDYWESLRRPAPGARAERSSPTPPASGLRARAGTRPGKRTWAGRVASGDGTDERSAGERAWSHRLLRGSGSRTRLVGGILPGPPGSLGRPEITARRARPDARQSGRRTIGQSITRASLAAFHGHAPDTIAEKSHPSPHSGSHPERPSDAPPSFRAGLLITSFSRDTVQRPAALLAVFERRLRETGQPGGRGRFRGPEKRPPEHSGREGSDETLRGQSSRTTRPPRTSCGTSSPPTVNPIPRRCITDRDTGRSKGFGPVEFANDQEARAAISGLKRQGCGRPRPDLVNEARPREEKAAAAAEGAGGTGTPDGSNHRGGQPPPFSLRMRAALSTDA